MPAVVPAAAPAAPQPRPGCSLGGFHAVGDTWHTSGRDGCLEYTCQRSGVASSQPYVANTHVATEFTSLGFH